MAEEILGEKHLIANNGECIKRWREKTICDITSRVPVDKLKDYIDKVKENIDIGEIRNEVFNDIIRKLVASTNDKSMESQSIELDNGNVFGVFHCKKEDNQTFSLAYAIHTVMYDIKSCAVDKEVKFLDIGQYQEEAAYKALGDLDVSLQKEAIPIQKSLTQALMSNLYSYLPTPSSIYGAMGLPAIMTGDPAPIPSLAAGEPPAASPHRPHSSFEETFSSCVAVSIPGSRGKSSTKRMRNSSQFW